LRRSNLLACEGLLRPAKNAGLATIPVFLGLVQNAIVLVDGIRHFCSVEAAFMSPYDYFHSTQSPTSFSTTLAPLWLMFSGKMRAARPACSKASAWPTRCPGWPAAWKTRSGSARAPRAPTALAPACRAPGWPQCPRISGRRRAGAGSLPSPHPAGQVTRLQRLDHQHRPADIEDGILPQHVIRQDLAAPLW